MNIAKAAIFMLVGFFIPLSVQSAAPAFAKIEAMINLDLGDGNLMFYMGKEAGIEKGKVYSASIGGQEAGQIKFIEVGSKHSKAEIVSGRFHEGDKLSLSLASEGVAKIGKSPAAKGRGGPKTSGMKTLEVDEKKAVKKIAKEEDEEEEPEVAVGKKKKPIEEEPAGEKAEEKPAEKTDKTEKKDELSGPKPKKARPDKPGEFTGLQVRYGTLSLTGDSIVEKRGGTLDAGQGWGVGYRVRNLEVFYSNYDLDATLAGSSFKTNLEGFTAIYLRKFNEEVPMGWYAGAGRSEYSVDSDRLGVDKTSAWNLLLGYDLENRASLEYGYNISEDDDLGNSNSLSLSYTF